MWLMIDSSKRKFQEQNRMKQERRGNRVEKIWMADKREEMKKRRNTQYNRRLDLDFLPNSSPASRMTVLLHLTAQSPTHHLPLPFSLPLSNTLAICLFISCSLHLCFLSPGSSLSSINFLQASTSFSLSFTSSEMWLSSGTIMLQMYLSLPLGCNPSILASF